MLEHVGEHDDVEAGVGELALEERRVSQVRDDDPVEAFRRQCGGLGIALDAPHLEAALSEFPTEGTEPTSHVEHTVSGPRRARDLMVRRIDWLISSR